MKKLSNCLFVFLLVAVLVFAEMAPSAAVTVQAATKTIKVEGKYYQSDARKMKKMVNDFRTGDDAWYYAKNGSDEVVYVEGLGKLKYDYELEKIAMQRAAEIYVSFSHTRPNGKDCFSLFPSGYMGMGENIAMGTSRIMSTNDAFILWQETDEPYSGQGHRRNMLYEGFTCIGIACFEIDGDKYWVQEFGTPKSSTKKTKACNKKKTVKVEVLSD